MHDATCMLQNDHVMNSPAMPAVEGAEDEDIGKRPVANAVPPATAPAVSTQGRGCPPGRLASQYSF